MSIKDFADSSLPSVLGTHSIFTDDSLVTKLSQNSHHGNKSKIVNKITVGFVAAISGLGTVIYRKFWDN
jgi:hypothetical protein